MSKKNEVVEAKTTEVAAPINMNEWGDVAVESKDLILPKILLQQAMSEAVKERTARDGDYLNTLLSTVCSNEKGEVAVLPFFCRQSYVVEKFNGRKFEYLRTDPYIIGEQARPWEEDIGGVKHKNVHVYEFFCLTEEGGLPAIVPFKSTSHKTGKKLFNIMYVANKQLGKAPAHNWIVLGRKEDSNESGDKYWVMDIAVGRTSTPEEITECLSWIRTIKESNVSSVEERPSTTQAQQETRF